MGPLILLALTTLLMLPLQLHAQEHAFLIDRSGSVKPHYRELIPALCGTLSKVLEGNGGVALIVFGTSQEKIADCDHLPEVSDPRGFENDTLLDDAFAYALRETQPAILWIVTDNIQDPPGAQSGNTAAFYQRLEADGVGKVVVFPFVASPGIPGLLVYAILLSSESEVGKAFENEVLAFKQKQGQDRTEALQMKPLDRDTLQIVPPQMEINRTSAGKKRVYREGVPIKEEKEISFRSKFGHLAVDDALITCPTEAEWKLNRSSPLILPQRRAKITPERITRLDALGEMSGYKVSVQTGPIALKKDLSSLMTMAFSGSEENVILDVTCVVRVPQKSFSVKKSFLERYNANKPEDAKRSGKIYGIDTLPTQLAKAETIISVPVRIEATVVYPWWPALVLILGLLLGVGAVGGCIWAALTYGPSLISRGPGWIVSAETSSGRTLFCAVKRNGEILVEETTLGRIQGNTFLVNNGIVGERGQQQFPLQGQTTVTVQQGRISTKLKFLPQDAGRGKTTDEEPRVGRRR